MTTLISFLPVVVVGLVFLAIIGTASYKRRRFDRQWPPISEDQFIARCTPGTNRERALRVRRIIAEQLGIPYEQIYPEQDFVDDLDC